MKVDHEKNALCVGYMVEFIHGATENYYERGSYASTYFNNIKFPLYVLKILKLCLFYFPMQVDSCSHKLFALKIPMHRKWVRLKCASHILHDSLFVFQLFSFMRASLKSSCLDRKALKKSACWEMLPLEHCVGFPRRGEDDAAKQRKYFPQFLRTKVSIQQENQATQCKQPLHANNNTSQPDVLKGLSIPFGVRRQKLRGQEINCSRLK